MTRVLVVDDEKNVLTTLKIGLKRKKIDVCEAHSGPQALALLETQACDVLISDIRMAPMDGYTLAKRVRTEYPGMGIVLMSAYAIEESQLSTLENISCTRLIKPFTIDALLSAIQRELNKGTKGDLLIMGDDRARKAMRERVETMGYRTGAVEPGVDLSMLLEQKKWRGVLVDGESLDEIFLPTLNSIDRLAPELPVILLARNSSADMPGSKEEEGVLVLDKQRFLEDAPWAGHILENLFK